MVIFGKKDDKEREQLTPGEWLQTTIDRAVRINASDIHIEPTATKVVVRTRIDGILRVVDELDTSFFNPIISSLKVMAGLNITETRRPQDGHILFNLQSTAGGPSAICCSSGSTRLCIWIRSTRSTPLRSSERSSSANRRRVDVVDAVLEQELEHRVGAGQPRVRRLARRRPSSATSTAPVASIETAAGSGTTNCRIISLSSCSRMWQ